MIKLNWGGKSFVTGYVTGAADFDSGKAKDISGITADDASGKITIHLDKAYGAFPNVLAFPELGVVPTGTPMKTQSTNPPPGVGPYMITDVVPNRSYSLKKVPGFAALNIPDIPTGHIDTFNFKLVSDTQSEVEQVLSDAADVFDPGDTITPSLLSQVTSQAADRFQKQTIPSTFYMFLNTTKPPFNNALAREAVNVGVDRRALPAAGVGLLGAGLLLPAGGHRRPPDRRLQVRDPGCARTWPRPRQLLKQSGQMGAKVVVWGETRVRRASSTSTTTPTR